MDWVEEMIIQDFERYRSTLEALEAELAQLPKGHLTFRETKGHQYWYLQYKDPSGLQNIRISEKELDGMQRLLSHRKMLKQTIQKIKFWVSVYKKHIPLLSNFILPPNSAVFAESEKPYTTLAGIFVRSKSEAMITNALYTNKISFIYEKPLYLPDSDKPIYPDFTIYTPCQNKVIYWEHLGLADNQDYMAKWHQKERRYAAANISPRTGNLIITQESHNAPFDLDSVMGKITWLRQQ